MTRLHSLLTTLVSLLWVSRLKADHWAYAVSTFASRFVAQCRLVLSIATKMVSAPPVRGVVSMCLRPSLCILKSGDGEPSLLQSRVPVDLLPRSEQTDTWLVQFSVWSSANVTYVSASWHLKNKLWRVLFVKTSYFEKLTAGVVRKRSSYGESVSGLCRLFTLKFCHPGHDFEAMNP